MFAVMRATVTLDADTEIGAQCMIWAPERLRALRSLKPLRACITSAGWLPTQVLPTPGAGAYNIRSSVLDSHAR